MSVAWMRAIVMEIRQEWRDPKYNLEVKKLKDLVMRDEEKGRLQNGF